MRKLLKPTEVKGNINAPSSKSMMQRAIAASLLANGKSVLQNPSFCEDSKAALKVAETLGATVEINNSEVIINGGLNLKGNILNCGEAGLSIRMFTPIAALFDTQITLSGSGSLTKRPVEMIEGPLKALGVECSTNNGFLPIYVKGPLKGGEITIDASISSQLLTGLLIALPLAESDTLIHVENLNSYPYIDMTLQLLKDFGVVVENENYKLFKIKGKQQYQPRNYFVEGDWSGASFLLVAGAISGMIKVKGLKNQSLQADKEILKALQKCGSELIINTDSIVVKNKRLDAFELDATNCPDLFPPLAALAVYCKGDSYIKGVSRLKFKESDRAKVLVDEFSKIGIQIRVSGDYLVVTGGNVIGGTIDSHNDHRIAMAAALLSIKSQNSILIEGAECVAKSYPEFYLDFEKIGGKVKNID